MSGIFSQLGLVREATYGTPLAVTRFFEFNNESIDGLYDRIESAALRSNQRVLRSDRWAINQKGATGQVELEVMSKGFAYLLEPMLGGAVTTVGPTETTAYNHTFKVGTLLNKAFTLQIGRPDTSGTVQPFTYRGTKVAGWELSNSVDGMLMCRLTLDAQGETTATGLASASYPTTMEVLNFTGGVVTIGGSATAITDITISADNAMKTDRYFIRALTDKKEPLEAGMRVYNVSITLEFENLTTYSRAASATIAGAMADVVATWQGSIITGATTLKNQLVATLSTVRFDDFAPQVGGPDLLTATLTGKVVDSGSANTAVQLAYQTSDTVP